ncbi:hypothetical protein DDE82_005226 [Stemphylium lycopersici]|nr:hypothetical protein TW65_03261 [Stemphylium lycopersici]RAR03384.1 hypothetical protein DDE82_005226 [Stemphylium lycopersici]
MYERGDDLMGVVQSLQMPPCWEAFLILQVISELPTAEQIKTSKIIVPAMSNLTNMNYVGGEYPEHLLDILGFERGDDWSTRDSETLTAKDFILSDSWGTEMQHLRYESMPIIGEPGFATNYDCIISTKSVSWMAQHDCEDRKG